MRLSLARLFFPLIAIALAGCQGNRSESASPSAAAASVDPTVACERGCSVGYDSCLDAAQAAAGKSGKQSELPQEPTEMCREQLKVCCACLN